ncbi:hypothetical protein MSHOH_1180 [Methanosarcina horonobensis HB-1 = JCM 15518]|uniref:Uncharacterized protein n=1 Tax=Methanosarcina horonobensis HB-1 = JCM 15518 TaxID=1434110 RepID=A0A0E3SDU7_9EURY|nr:hypothetical protein MSHOH_1180 [Methanosarcina horonobensis HB-1 = JCM 15518]
MPPPACLAALPKRRKNVKVGTNRKSKGRKKLENMIRAEVVYYLFSSVSFFSSARPLSFVSVTRMVQ